MIGQQDDDDVGDGRGVPEAEEFETELVDVPGDRLGRGAGAALGEHEDQIEDLEGVEGTKEDRHRDHAGDARQARRRAMTATTRRHRARLPRRAPD